MRPHRLSPLGRTLHRRGASRRRTPDACFYQVVRQLIGGGVLTPCIKTNSLFRIGLETVKGSTFELAKAQRTENTPKLEGWLKPFFHIWLVSVVSFIFKNNSHPSTIYKNPPISLQNPPTPSFFPPTTISTLFSVFFFFYKNQREIEDKDKQVSPNGFFYDIQKLGDFWPFLRKVGGSLGDENRYLGDGESPKSLNLLNSAVRVGVTPQSLNVSPPCSGKVACRAAWRERRRSPWASRDGVVQPASCCCETENNSAAGQSRAHEIRIGCSSQPRNPHGTGSKEGRTY